MRNGRFTLESGRVAGAGASASMTGRVSDLGAISARATGSLSRPLTLPGATTLSSLAFAADISGQVTAPRVALRLADGAISVAGMRADRVVGQAQVTLGEKISGDFALSGGSAGQPLVARGRLAGGKGVWRINNLNATLGGLQLNAPQMQSADGVFSAAFDASGSLVGYAGLDRGTLSARGTVSAGEDLVADISGQLLNLRHGEMQVDLVSFDADAKNGDATISGKLKGRFGAPVDLAFDAKARHADDAWAGTANLTGTIDQYPVATERPANWRFGGGGWMVDSRFAAFKGTLDADLASSEAGATAHFDLQKVEVRGLSRLARITPIDGQMTGSADFNNGAGPATGNIRLRIENANPVGVKANPIEVTITSNLENGKLTSTANGKGQGFTLKADSAIRTIAGDGFDVRPDMAAPAEGSVTLNGRAEQLWALFGPDGQDLRGQLNADVSLAGTLGEPLLTGGFQVADAAYQHGETGLSLRNLKGKGVFDQRSARITEVSADDGQGGTISGEGRIDWDSGIDGGVQFKASNLRALARDDRSAIVSGDGAVTIEPEAIRVTGELDVSQARISIEQPASARIPKLPMIRRANFPNQEEAEPPKPDNKDKNEEIPLLSRPVQLDLKITAPRRVVVFGRGLDTEWSADFRVRGAIANPEVQGTATLVRGDLDLAGRRFQFDTGSINLDGPIRSARIDIKAERTAEDIDATVHVTGSPVEPKFELESTPSLPQDEILARVLFGRSMAELSALEAAQLAAGLTQLAGGNAGFDPVGLVRQATGLDRVSVSASGGVATVSAGKYVAKDVYLQIGAGGEGGVGAEVEWEPRDNLAITSSAQGNGDTKIAVRWKNDY